MNEQSRFHPDPESLSVIELPLSLGFLDRLNRDRTWRFTGILLGACVVFAGAIFGLTGDSFVIFEMIEAVFFGALALIPAGIVFGICAGLGSMHLQKARELLQSEFLAAVADAYDSQPGFLNAFVPDQKFARLYAFDNKHRALFLMRPHRHKKSWHILRLP